MCNADAILVCAPSRLSSTSSSFGGSGKALRWQVPPRSHIRYRGQRVGAAPIRAAKVRTLPGVTDGTGRCKCSGCTTRPLTVVPGIDVYVNGFSLFPQHRFWSPNHHWCLWCVSKLISATLQTCRTIMRSWGSAKRLTKLK
jgi:hypothetical protein